MDLGSENDEDGGTCLGFKGIMHQSNRVVVSSRFYVTARIDGKPRGGWTVHELFSSFKGKKTPPTPTVGISFLSFFFFLLFSSFPFSFPFSPPPQFGQPTPYVYVHDIFCPISQKIGWGKWVAKIKFFLGGEGACEWFLGLANHFWVFENFEKIFYFLFFFMPAGWSDDTPTNSHSLTEIYFSFLFFFLGGGERDG